MSTWCSFPRAIGATVVLAALGAGCAIVARDAQPRQPDAELLHAAMEQLTGTMVYDIFSPPQASRVYAYASVAAYEVVRQGQPGYRTFAGQLSGLAPVPASAPGRELSLPLAGVHAFMTVGRALTFSRARMDSLRRAMDGRIRAGGMSREVYERSIAYGDTVAGHILAWAASDHYSQTRGYPKFSISRSPGRWIPTPPAYMDAVEASWGALRPFVMDTASQFRPPAPAPFDTAAGSVFMAQAREVRDTRLHLTDEQREIASFWDCNPYTMHVQGHAMFATKKITPGGHWMGIAAVASRQAHADLAQSAEAYARTAVALADSFISAWDEKYRSARVRPETVINRYLDEGWEPLLQTPPFPEYPSAHSVVSAAAAIVLTQLYGPSLAFVDSTEVQFGLPARAFASFEAAANEAALSRLYGGIHFRPAIENGLLMGRGVGALVVARVHTRDAVVAAAAASGSAALGAR